MDESGPFLGGKGGARPTASLQPQAAAKLVLGAAPTDTTPNRSAHLAATAFSSCCGLNAGATSRMCAYASAMSAGT